MALWPHHRGSERRGAPPPWGPRFAAAAAGPKPARNGQKTARSGSGAASRGNENSGQKRSKPATLRGTPALVAAPAAGATFRQAAVAAGLSERACPELCAQRNNCGVEGDSPISADTKIGTVPSERDCLPPPADNTTAPPPRGRAPSALPRRGGHDLPQPPLGQNQRETAKRPQDRARRGLARQ